MSRLVGVALTSALALMGMVVAVLLVPGAVAAQGTERVGSGGTGVDLRMGELGSGSGEVVRRFVAAINAEDVEAALACFGEGAVAFGGSVGKDALRARILRDFAVHRRMAITGMQVVENRVVWSWQATEESDRRLGLPPIEGTDEATVLDGVMVSNTGAVHADSMRRRQAAVATQTAYRVQEWSGGFQGLPSTQERGTPAVVPWAVGALALLVLCAGLAAFRRPGIAAGEG